VLASGHYLRVLRKQVAAINRLRKLPWGRSSTCVLDCGGLRWFSVDTRFESFDETLSNKHLELLSNLWADVSVVGVKITETILKLVGVPKGK
jgi:hypothetical protein